MNMSYCSIRWPAKKEFNLITELKGMFLNLKEISWLGESVEHAAQTLKKWYQYSLHFSSSLFGYLAVNLSRKLGEFPVSPILSRKNHGKQTFYHELPIDG